MTSIQDMFSLGAVTAEQITQARISIESAIIRAACEAHTAGDIKRLRENLELAAEATRRNDFFARANLHLEFHLILASVTRNPILIVVMEALIGLMRQFIHSIGSQQIADYVLPSRKRFMQYFEARKADAAVDGNGAPPEAHQPQLSRASGRTVEVKRDCHGTTIDWLEAIVASIARPAGPDRAASVRQYLVEEVPHALGAVV